MDKPQRKIKLQHWFLKNIYKTDKPLVKLIFKKGEKMLIYNKKNVIC